MEQNVKQPKTIFEQIVFGQEVTNDNIVALAHNLDVVNAKIDTLLAIFTMPPAKKENSEPDASGAETKEQ